MTVRWRWDGAAKGLNTHWWLASENGAIVLLCTSHGQDAGHVSICSQQDFFTYAKTVKTFRMNKQWHMAKSPTVEKKCESGVSHTKEDTFFPHSRLSGWQKPHKYTEPLSPRQTGSNSHVTIEHSDIWLRDNWPNWQPMLKGCCRTRTLGDLLVPWGATNSTNPDCVPLGFGFSVADLTVTLLLSAITHHSISNTWLGFKVCWCSRSSVSSLAFGLKYQKQHLVNS